MGDPRVNLHSTIWRVHVGTLALSTTLIPILKRAVFVAGKYSFRRQVTGSGQHPGPIIRFRTQQRPILRVLAQIAVYDRYADASTALFQDRGMDYRVRHGVAAAFKAVLTQGAQTSLFALSERCGAQGLFEYNEIVESQLEARGISIAEGDTMTLSISAYFDNAARVRLRLLTHVPYLGLASELLLGKYSMPAPKDASCPLARYEKHIFDVCRRYLRSFSGGHRSDEYNAQILPHCQTLVEAIGHRMAYEAAREAAIEPNLLTLYEAGVLLQAPAWYVRGLRLDLEAQFQQEARAIDSLLPRLNQLLDATGAAPYCSAPILTNEAWNRFVDGLEGYGAEEGQWTACPGGSAVQSKL